MSEKKTVRVRIAVAVTASGNWVADGWTDPIGGEATLRDAAFKYLERKDDEAFHVVWIEATVPIPTEATIEGSVTDA